MEICHKEDTAAKSLQSCPTLCDPIDSSPPGSPVPGIVQARTLEWVAMKYEQQYTNQGKNKRAFQIKRIARKSGPTLKLYVQEMMTWSRI